MYKKKKIELIQREQLNYSIMYSLLYYLYLQIT
jgi:hypothetical protein